MMKYYTAVGRYDLRPDADGLMQPVLCNNGKEYAPTVSEMLLWGLLLWHIRDGKELRQQFEEQRRQMHICEDLSYEYYVRRLEMLGHIRSGTGYTAFDALYALLAPLYLVPATTTFWGRFCSFLHLVLRRGMPLRLALRVFRKDRLAADEQSVMSLITQNTLSTAELISCLDQGLRDVTRDDTIMEHIYSNPHVSCDNLPVYTRVSERLEPTLRAVTSLYLRRLILLEAY